MMSLVWRTEARGSVQVRPEMQVVQTTGQRLRSLLTNKSVERSPNKSVGTMVRAVATLQCIYNIAPFFL